MSPYNKPLPKPTAYSREFWDGTRRHELLIQQCEECERKVFYPKKFCPYCSSSNLRWIKASGRGKVYSFSTVLYGAPSSFVSDVPYVVAIVRLEEGVQLMSNVVDCKPENVRCDMEVEVIFDDVTEEITLPKFRPVT